MNATTASGWKFTSFSSYLKTVLTRDLPITAVLGLVLLGGNFAAKTTLNPDVYSKLGSGFEIGMDYLGVALFGFLALLSAASFGASLYAGFYRRQPRALCIRMGAMSLVSMTACEWALIHMAHGGLA